jgi:hypothetical protein
LNGQDAAAFIVSANLAQRNLKKGQQAMLLAMIYPEPEKGGRGKKSVGTKAAEASGFSARRLEQARSVLGHSRALAEQVAAGPLDTALKQVEEERQQIDAQENLYAALRRQAPDLADLVDEERLSLEDAYATYVARKAKAEAAEANKREVMVRLGEAGAPRTFASTSAGNTPKSRTASANWCTTP